MNKQQVPVIREIAAIFWLGFFMAISFMEAPLKFTAPGITIVQGVQIGRIVFGVLNKCEWGLLLIVLCTCLFSRPRALVMFCVFVVCIILLGETFWLLPMLDARATQYIAGHQQQDTDMHWWYIILEILKVPTLFIIGWKEVTGGWRKLTIA
ncbi:MAG TPA: hypothetical protein VIM89_15570 [Mucilaginibacter sp.]